MTEEELQNLIDAGHLSEIENVKPIVPSQPATPAHGLEAPSKFYVGSLSPALSNDAQFNRNAYQTGPVAVHPLMPLPPSGQANINSASNSAANQNQFLANQAKNAATTAVGTALPGTVVASGSTIQPATLNSVADSTTRYAQQASGLTYKPTTNPLIAFDSGGSAAVDIDSFFLLTSTKGQISIDSGSVAALSYGTLYYIYYSDPTLAGGDVTFQATLDRNLALDGAGNIFIGSITTPLAGGPNTTGNGDGGSAGAPTGSTNILGFQSPAPTTSGNGTVANPFFAVDNTSTSACVLALTGDGSANQSEITTGLAAGVIGAYSSLTVNVLFSVPTNSLTGSPANPVVTILISDLTGVTYATQTINSGVTMGLTTLSASIPVGLNSALLTVTVEALSGAGAGPYASGGQLEVDVFNISTVAVQ